MLLIITNACDDIGPVDSHSGAKGNILAGPPNIFEGAPLGRNLKKFLNGAF